MCLSWVRSTLALVYLRTCLGMRTRHEIPSHPESTTLEPAVVLCLHRTPVARIPRTSPHPAPQQLVTGDSEFCKETRTHTGCGGPQGCKEMRIHTGCGGPQGCKETRILCGGLQGCKEMRIHTGCGGPQGCKEMRIHTGCGGLQGCKETRIHTGCGGLQGCKEMRILCGGLQGCKKREYTQGVEARIKLQETQLQTHMFTKLRSRKISERQDPSCWG